MEQIIKKLQERYNLEISFHVKFSKVYNISFKLENQELSFVYMYDSLKSFENNLKEVEHKLNSSIIEFYKKKGVKK